MRAFFAVETFAPRTVTLAIGMALALSACTYSPNIESGALACSQDTRECPRGYTCASSGPYVGRCVNGNTLPGGGGNTVIGTAGTSGTTDGGLGGPHGDAKVDAHPDLPAIDSILPGTGGAGGGAGPGTGGATMSSSNPNDYLGSWAFDASSYVYTDCGATPFMNTLSGTTLVITYAAAGDGTFNAVWSEFPDCPYQLYLDSTGLHLYDTSWTCSNTTGDPADYWAVYWFDVTTTNGKTGAHEASYLRGDFYANGTTTYCDQTVHATMTKH